MKWNSFKGSTHNLLAEEVISVCNHLSHSQRKEWTWDESKMMIMQDPIYRSVTHSLIVHILIVYAKQM